MAETGAGRKIFYFPLHFFTPTSYTSSDRFVWGKVLSFVLLRQDTNQQSELTSFDQIGAGGTASVMSNGFDPGDTGSSPVAFASIHPSVFCVSKTSLLWLFQLLVTLITEVSLDVTFTSGWRRLNHTLGAHGAQFGHDFFLDTSVHVSRFSDYQYTALGSLYQTTAWFFFLMYHVLFQKCWQQCL